jgi:hypothetical protein
VSLASPSPQTIYCQTGGCTIEGEEEKNKARRRRRRRLFVHGDL